MEPCRRRPGIVLWSLVLGLTLAGCATPDPMPPSTEDLAGTSMPAGGTAMPTSGSVVPTFPTGPRTVPSRPRGVSSDPGTRYLGHGVTGALTVETAPRRSAAAAARPEADDDDLGLPPTGRLPGTDPGR